MFLRTPETVPTIQPDVSDVLYLGVSTNLARRSIGTHFATGRSGSSTLRRTLGALLIDHLGLTPRPRGASFSRSNFVHYRFDDAGEQRLTQWMHEHLDTAVYPVPDPELIEPGLVAAARPPLNLTYWPNPHCARIKAVRAACVRAAGA